MKSTAILQKQLWENLAKANSRYYIFTDFGKNITEKQFDHSGLQDCRELVFDDPLLKSRRHLLEIGCGTGRMTRHLSAAFKKITAVDISGEMISQARSRLAGCKNVDLYETDGQSFPLADKSVDVVFSYIVFQHLRSRRLVKKNFLEARRVLRPKGIFKVLLKNSGEDRLERWWGGVAFSESAIKKMCIETDFKIIQSRTTPTGGIWLWLT